MRTRYRIAAACLCASLAVFTAGCQSISGAYGRLFGTGPVQKPAELVPIKQPTAQPKLLWHANVGGAGRSVFVPAVNGNVVYAAGTAGQITGLEATTGKQVVSFKASQPITSMGAGEGLLVAGTLKGQLLAFDREGKPQWTAQLTGEILAPPVVAQSTVVVRTGDGRIFALDAATGKRKWIYQRTLPALSVRNYAGVEVYRGAVFAGFPGGRMVAIALANGNVGWEAAVAIPRGTTELERVADITSEPVVGEREACAVAFQGRVACFELRSGSSIWARDVSSAAGMGADSRNLYITDDKNAVVALDKTTGASLWKQDKLAGRGVTGPLALGRYVLVGDFQGYVHFLSREDGAFAARVATDGSAILAHPVALDMSSFVVQTQKGGVYAISLQ